LTNSSPRIVAGSGPNFRADTTTWGGNYYDFGRTVGPGGITSLGPTEDSSYALLGFGTTWRNGTGFNEAEALAGNPYNMIEYVTGTTATSLTAPSFMFILGLDYHTILWQKYWTGANNATSIAADPSGQNYYVTGSTDRFGAGGRDAFILKFNSTVGLIWQRTWGGAADDIGRGVTVDSSDNIYLTGSTSSFGGQDAFLLKLNSTGGLVWQGSWRGQGEASGASIAMDSADYIYVTGTTSRLPNALSYLFLLKFDQNGNLVSQETWGGQGSNSGNSLSVYSTGLFVAGMTSGYGTSCGNILLLSFDLSTNLIYQVSWGGSANDGIGGVSWVNEGTPGPGIQAELTGQVNEGPPYTVCTATDSALSSTNYSLSSPSGMLGTSLFAMGNLQGAISTFGGSQFYAGNGDVFVTTIW